MSEFDDPFETYMSAGVQANNAGRHEEALEMRFNAFTAANNLVEMGRAARDIGHSFAALGDDGRQFETGEPENATFAEAYAEYALRAHTAARATGEVGAEREYRASAGYVGTMALQRAIATEKTGKLPQETVQEAVDMLAEATLGPADDQYTINFIARYATAISLYENGALGRGIAKEAWRLGKMSERSDLPHSTPGLSIKERRMAQVKAMGRAAGAFVVGGLTSLSNTSAMDVRRPKLRKLGLIISERML